MNVLILHGKDGEKSGRELRKHIKKNNLKCRLMNTESKAGKLFSPAYLESFSHMIISDLVDCLNISPVAFVLGFFLGTSRPIVWYSVTGDQRPPDGMESFFHIVGDAEINSYLNDEAEAWISREKYRQAKAELLNLGIPFTKESLEKCVSGGNDRALSLFLSAGFSPDTKDAAGVPLLCLAARSGGRAIVRMLLEAGASVNLQADDRGTSALIDAGLRKHCDIVEDLIAAGADVNIKSKDGQSALIIAAGSHDEACAEVLLKAGADPDTPDSLGVSARKYTELFKRPGMLALFARYAPGNA